MSEVDSSNDEVGGLSTHAENFKLDQKISGDGKDSMRLGYKCGQQVQNIALPRIQLRENKIWNIHEGLEHTKQIV